MSAPQDIVEYPFVKGLTALFAGYGVASWGDFAALVASIYTVWLLGELLLKRIILPFCRRWGWLRR